LDLSDKIKIISFSFSKGKIVIYDFETNALVPNAGIEDLHAGVVPRSVTYLNTLLMCNGIDSVFSWNGTTFEAVYDFVKEQAVAFNRIDATHFSFTANAAFDINKYPANGIIQLIVNGTTSTLTVANIVRNLNIVTITTVENLPAFSGQDRIELFYKDYPPAFSFMHVAMIVFGL